MSHCACFGPHFRCEYKFEVVQTSSLIYKCKIVRPDKAIMKNIFFNYLFKVLCIFLPLMNSVKIFFFLFPIQMFFLK